MMQTDRKSEKPIICFATDQHCETTGEKARTTIVFLQNNLGIFLGILVLYLYLHVNSDLRTNFNCFKNQNPTFPASIFGNKVKYCKQILKLNRVF